MSTRCQVLIKANGKKLELYHHYDGYIEGVGFLLKKILDSYVELKDKIFPDSLVCKMIKYGNFEPTFILHGDIEYYYELNFDEEYLIAYHADAWDGKLKKKIIGKFEITEKDDVQIEEDLVNKLKELKKLVAF